MTRRTKRVNETERKNAREQDERRDDKKGGRERKREKGRERGKRREAFILTLGQEKYAAENGRNVRK